MLDAVPRPGEAKFSLSRALVVGGLAGILGGWGVWSVDGEGILQGLSFTWTHEAAADALP
jgi:hypothetical protein